MSQKKEISKLVLSKCKKKIVKSLWVVGIMILKTIFFSILIDLYKEEYRNIEEKIIWQYGFYFSYKNWIWTLEQ